MYRSIPNTGHINVSAFLLIDDLMAVFLMLVLSRIEIMAQSE